MSDRINPIGTLIANPEDDNIHEANRVRMVATAGPVTGTLKTSAEVVIGQFYLHAEGATVIVHKAFTDEITCATAIANKIGT